MQTKKPTNYTASTLPPDIDDTLSHIIDSWTDQQSFNASVVVKELNGDERTASYKPDTQFITASTYKLYVAYAILLGIQNGKYQPDTMTSDGHTIQSDLNLMILNSDDTAGRTLGFLYGWKNINTLLASQGLTHTNLYNYIPPSTAPNGDKYTTTSDLAVFLNKLYSGLLLSTTNTAQLLNLMKNQRYRERIPAGVPSTVPVADKPGWLSPADGEDGYTENDAAIVYGPKSTYIVTITTTSSSTVPLATLSKEIYDYLEV